jgi:hypothetical protein
MAFVCVGPEQVMRAFSQTRHFQVGCAAWGYESVIFKKNINLETET